ncbi:MAG: beta-N-acetylhexosaminidase [Acetobacteraceae bacterium]|nr:beta-N-acetylhexosaminidase [Acetobacteraceae bacterium]
MKAAIVGVGGIELSLAEERLLRAHPPAGIILFARNIESPTQLRALIAETRRVLPPRAVLMVDQEGGRVARLRPPNWRVHPAAASIGAAGERAAWLTGALIGLDCSACGFDVVCAPVLDLRWPGAADVIGDRAFSDQPQEVARLGTAFADGLLASGIQPVMKHLPGHGRAQVDSHLALPRVEEADLEPDLLPFAANAHLPWAMTAHIVYPCWDLVHPATLSPSVIGSVIRGRIGFRGVLVSDDLAMHALSGPPEARASAALEAGCDLALYCTGELETNAAVLESCPEITGAALARLHAARRLADERRIWLDPDVLAVERERLLGYSACSS